MAAKTTMKTYRKECEYCKTEYTSKSPTSKTCSRACRTAKCRASQAAEVESVTTVTVTPVTPEISQPDGAQKAFIESIAMAVGEAIAVKMGIQMVGLGDIIARGIKDAINEVALMQAKLPQERTDLPKVPFGFPKELPDTNDVPPNQTNTFEVNFDDLTLPKVDVKKATVTDDSKADKYTANFMNLIAAFKDPEAGYFDPNAKVHTRR